MFDFRRLSRSAFLAIFLGYLSLPFALAEEGMWPPSLLNAALFEQMKAKGFLLTPEAIYSTNRPSIKDAVVLFGRGCTAEIISSQGLLLTNHHCGFGQIQSHSTLQNDYLQNGFWAKNRSEELPNPGLTISILVRMEDVTSRLKEGVLPSMAGPQRFALMEANQKKILAKATEGTLYQAQIKPFFGGMQQWMLVYETFQDIRLVGAPPSSIGKFGGDTDNWVWPRHTGDFCLFRIYAGKDNKPAAYSLDNIPYTPKKYLSVSTAGIKEGDFTMIVGYPGRTNEYLPSYALEMVTQVSNPKKVTLRESRLNIINEAMRNSALNRIRYSATQADIANAWKKWKGESLGMAKADAIGAKRKTEERYRNYFRSRGEQGKTGLEALDKLEKGYQELRKWIIPAQYQAEAVQANEVFTIVNLTQGLLPKAGASRDETDRKKKLDSYKASVRSVWKDADPLVERALFEVCLKAYRKDIPEELHSPSFLALLKEHPFENGRFAQAFFDKGNWFDSLAVWKLAEKVSKGDSLVLQKNPTWKILDVLNRQFNGVYLPAYQKVAGGLESSLQVFLAGLMEMDSTKSFYPDANQTFRFAFGNVAGYKPMDGVSYGWQTTTAGIMEKADTEPDFMLSPELKSIYTRQNMSAAGLVPVAFIASNHSTGGNSGSPVLNARGELIGVNFDRVWEGTMSDYFFDSRICRNITCDIRYILWVIEQVGGSSHLVKEMELK